MNFATVKMMAAILTLSLAFSPHARAQDDFENEFNEAEGEFSSPPPMESSTEDGALGFRESADPGATDVSPFDEPNEPALSGKEWPSLQKTNQASDIPAPGSFRKPPGPPGGGILEAPHPGTAKGLIKIQKDGSYVYKTPMLNKSRSASMRAGYLTSPSIKSVTGVGFGTIYGDGGIFGLIGEYEWQPFRRFGSLGLQLGAGLVIARGNGRFSNGSIAQEIYNLAVVPLSANLVYRFEYVRRQWIVPFISGGGILYGLAELRDDGHKSTFAAAPAFSAGGGVHFSISAWDSSGSFILAQDYGVADLWLTVEAKVIQGLDADLDFTNQTLSAGFTVDF